MQKRPTSTAKLRKTQSQAKLNKQEKTNQLPVLENPLSLIKNVKFLKSLKSPDIKMAVQIPNPKNEFLTQINVARSSTLAKPVSSIPVQKCLIYPELNDNKPYQGLRQTHNRKLPAMTPEIKRNVGIMEMTGGNDFPARFSCSSNNQFFNFQGMKERASCKTYKKPIVAINPLFKLKEPERNKQNELLGIPETIKRQEFIDLYFENLQLKENQKNLKKKIRENSLEKNDLKNKIRESYKENSVPKSTNEKSVPNCFVNYVTNNYNVNFLSPFKVHTKNQKSKDQNFEDLKKTNEKNELNKFDFSRFFFKKKNQDLDLKIKKRFLNQNEQITTPVNQRVICPGELRRIHVYPLPEHRLSPSEGNNCLSTQATLGSSTQNPSGNFSFTGFADQENQPMKSQPGNQFSEQRLEFTFSYRPNII